MAGKVQREVTADADDVSDPIIFNRRFDEATVKVVPGVGGTAVVQYTLDDPRDVQDDPDNADWDDWEPGTVNDKTTRALAGPVTAVRVAATTEPATLQVVTNFDY